MSANMQDTFKLKTQTVNLVQKHLPTIIMLAMLFTCCVAFPSVLVCFVGCYYVARLYKAAMNLHKAFKALELFQKTRVIKNPIMTEVYETSSMFWKTACAIGEMLFAVEASSCFDMHTPSRVFCSVEKLLLQQTLIVEGYIVLMEEVISQVETEEATVAATVAAKAEDEKAEKAEKVQAATAEAIETIEAMDALLASMAAGVAAVEKAETETEKVTAIAALIASMDAITDELGDDEPCSPGAPKPKPAVAALPIRPYSY